MNTDRAISRRIIESFERDMNALNYFKLELLPQQTSLNDELNTMSYATFEELLIPTEWRSYRPDRKT